ncbi:MAG: Crp/Fnr family transcriptional regulator [Terracidiphilus sp.]
MRLLSKEATRDLELIGSFITCDAGDILFLEQEPLQAVYIVVAGEVRLSLQDVNGKRMTVHIAKRGSVLGMSEALSGSPPEWSAEVLYAARIASIKRGDFLRFAECHPEIYRIAVTELVRTIRYTSRALRIVGLSSSASKRLASLLLAWGEQGQTMGDQTRYPLALTHTQIAEFVGTSRETVTRALAAFKERGLVET